MYNIINIGKEGVTMQKHLEFEFKSLLSQEEYERLIIKFKGNRLDLQTNHYFDTPRFSLKALSCSLRVRERDKAISRMGKTQDSTTEVIDDLTKVLVKKLLSDATVAVRGCAESGDIKSAENLVLAITRGKTCTRKED